MLIWRSAAFGDVIVTTPVVRHLKSQGHEIVYVTSKRGLEVLKNNPHIERVVLHKEETPIEKLSQEIEWLRKKFHCDRVIDFSESIEVALSQHPRSPNYKLSKPERLARFNRNFYEYSFEHAGENWKEGVDLKPELFFEDHEIRDAKKRLRDGCFNILLGLSGSGSNKAWPWGQDFAYKLCADFPDVHIITVGDEKCRLIEPDQEHQDQITCLSGKLSMRESMALTSVVDLVIAPDTGLLHASGCFDTPKIGLLGHNTIECITKYFRNDYSIESNPDLAPCSPCFYLIYNMKIQCPLNPISQGSVCMSDGITLEMVYERFSKVYAELKEGSRVS